MLPCGPRPGILCCGHALACPSSTAELSQVGDTLLEVPFVAWWP